jgi:hypothetical protein
MANKKFQCYSGLCIYIVAINDQLLPLSMESSRTSNFNGTIPIANYQWLTPTF